MLMIIMSNCVFVKCIWTYGRTKKKQEETKKIPADTGKSALRQIIKVIRKGGTLTEERKRLSEYKILISDLFHMFIDQEHPASVLIVPCAAEGKSHASSFEDAFFEDTDLVKVYVFFYFRCL